MNPDFLIIPYQVIADPTLRPTDRLLYGVIYWIANLKDGHCYASNGLIGEVCMVSRRATQEGFRRLEKAGYIRRVFDSHQPKRTRREEIVPLLAFRQGRTNVRGGIRTNVRQSYKSPKKKKRSIEEMKKNLARKLSVENSSASAANY